MSIRIIITIGDCNGIGIEILCKALREFLRLDIAADCRIRIAANTKTIDEYIRKSALNVAVADSSLIIENEKFEIIECGDYVPINFGSVSEHAGKLAAASIDKAANLIESNEEDAVVTMPISKEAIYMAAWQFPGHTEYFAYKAKSADSLMILFKGNIRVSLATVHIPLSKVAKLLSKELVISKTQLLNRSLQMDFGINSPKIALLGLNPHAGENGKLGKEENEMIIPAIIELNHKGINVEGPFPADGFFAHGIYKNYDGILAMYHDQGLIPLKLLANGQGINFTAGLNIIRTSVDHGTAFNLAGKNIANHESALESILAAVSIYKSRKKFSNTNQA